MKLFKVKAILYPLIGIGHIVFWRHLPNPVLAAAIVFVCFWLGSIFLCRWIKEG